MWLKLTAILAVSSFLISTNALIQVGVISKKGNESYGLIVEEALKSSKNTDIKIIKETADEENTAGYHRALCRLLSAGIDALISTSDTPYYPLLSAYAREYQIPLIAPELPQEVFQFSTGFCFGIKPVTSRAMLHVFHLYGWSNIIYLYDHNDGPENLNLIFAVGHSVLDLTLDGILKVTSAEEANKYLRRLDKSFKNKQFHVVLDTELNMARDILWLHVNDVHVRKRNFHFLLAKPTMEEFWTQQKAALGAINVTTFLIKNHIPGAKNLIHHTLTDSGEISQTAYYFYDAAIILETAATSITPSTFARDRAKQSYQPRQPRLDATANCFDDKDPKLRPNGDRLSRAIETINILGSTGHITFQNGMRSSFNLNVTEITPRGFHRIAVYSDGTLYPEILSRPNKPTASSLVQDNGRLRIVSKINPPYLMLKTEENETREDNNRFEGYCKDLIDLLAKEMGFEYAIHLVEDDDYGQYEKSLGKWTGIIGELIQGKADLAVADLPITGRSQRVVEFSDPFEMVGFSLVMKNPRTVSKLSKIYFFLSAFTVDVWVCILFSVLLFCILFHFITKYTGAPDSIESASGIWGRKHTAVVNVWFTIGTAMLQGTGVYPRSISSRILTGFFWFFTLILSAMFIASVTMQIVTVRLPDENSPQLSQIKSMSLESIIAESVTRGWPKIGIVKSSNTESFIKSSTLPLYTKFSEYLENNPDVLVSTENEGIERVRQSSGDYMVVLESLTAEYAIRRKPCDIISTRNAFHYAGYGLATPLGSHLKTDINKALHVIQESGALGDLHRKWWLDSSECKTAVVEDKKERTVHVFSGLLCVCAVGFLIIFGVFAFQYIRRNQTKESRRQQLSFEDMNLEQPLPTPPPELLAESPPVLNLPEYDRKTLL